MAESGVMERTGKTGYRVVVIGGSTGSIDVLLQLLPALQLPLSVGIVVVVHRKNTADSTLADLLALRTKLPVQEADEKTELLPGHIYLAPADYHLLLERDGSFSLDDSEKVHYSRPAIDVTFESLADVYGSAVVGVLLSGANADGTEGLDAIKRAGGLALVQHPDTAQVGYMPQQAIERVAVDAVLTIPELAQYINQLNARNRQTT
ncbi:two-component system, chemotaxis family, response regulator CheB [Fibrella aestuarina BUZ 2]|uniref:protein-glutamate methylesterase n=1 Tax=Fibrella aestuarina BUZ 2 TaxID=1166018 RepID=I0K783_9BACT|nr:two-component system, chemotaxis family, response regulator CheB [Fibrella aestuarina BUZ 2]